MKKYDIEMDYGAAVVNIYDDEELEDDENLLELIENGEIDTIEDMCYIDVVNELCVNGENVKGWNEDFGEVAVPKRGLYATGGWCRGRSYFTLELPDDEVFNTSKLTIIGFDEMNYRLNDNQIIAAEFRDDSEYKGQTGEVFYYNGELISEK